MRRHQCFLHDGDFFLCRAPAATLRLGQNLDGFHVMTRLTDSHKTTRYLRESSCPEIQGAAPAIKNQAGNRLTLSGFVHQIALQIP